MTNFKTELNITLAELIEQREVWESTSYKKANADLYAILEKCADIYVALKSEKTNARIFNAVVEGMDISFNKGTSLALKIVRVVFGKQTNREFAYARVIKIWYIDREESQSFTNFVIEQGGVENVRRNASTKVTVTLTADDYRDIAASALSGSTALTAFNIANYMLQDAENDTDYMVALVRCDGDGIGDVIYGSNKRMLVNTALAVIGKEINDLQTQHASKSDIAAKKEKVMSNIAQFVEKMRQNEEAA